VSGTAARRRLESRVAESLKQDGWFTDVRIPSVKYYFFFLKSIVSTLPSAKVTLTMSGTKL